jgi:hypothetical protein
VIVELQHAADAEPLDRMVDGQSHRVVGVMGAQEDYRALEARIANAGHRHQQATGEEWRFRVGHRGMIGLGRVAFKPQLRQAGLARRAARPMCGESPQERAS